MAVLDTNKTKKPYIVDRDTQIKIGIDLPIRRDDNIDGYFASTSTTIEAVKNNIKNLLQTEKGERYLQPDLGVTLRRHLFENVDEGVSDSIREDILSSFAMWLPFVKVVDLNVNIQSGEDDYSRNSINVDIKFSIDQIPNSLDSVQVQI